MAKLKDLVEEIKKHREDYYNEETEISDEKYDKLEDELREVDPDNPVLSKIGEDSSEDFTKKEHIIHMNSQDKVNTPEAFYKWCNKWNWDVLIVQHKLDGISVELCYEDGRFTVGISRGNGVVGDDISNNVRKMRGFVEELKDKDFTGGVRGEIVLYKDVFEEKYSAENKNPRNTASGIAKRKNSEGSEDLTIITYNAQVKDDDKYFSNELEKLFWLQYNKFNLIEGISFSSPQEVVKYKEKVEKERNTFQYNIDGLVIKSNVIDLEDQKRSKPQKQVAFKFEDEMKETILRDIVWEQSGPIFTPVAEFDPIEIEETTISKASLSNHSFIEKLGLYKNCRILVKKAGSIIPQIVKVIDE